MSTFRGHAVVVALVLLATLAFGSVAAQGHNHSVSAEPSTPSHLPVFSGGHEQPDRSAHVESATRLESPSCVACLHQQRQRAIAALPPNLGDLVPSFSPATIEVLGDSTEDSHRLPPSRAPPAA